VGSLGGGDDSGSGGVYKPLMALDVARKLRIRHGQSVALVNQPREVVIDLPARCRLVTYPSAANVVVVFTRTRRELEQLRKPLIRAAGRGARAWLAYPHGSDLTPGLIRRLLADPAVRPAGRVALDQDWCALSLRPTVRPQSSAPPAP
jgi:hypothetical protein